MIDHEKVQAALSARIDGEPSPLDEDIVDSHLAVCAECQRFHDEALVLSRRLRFVEPEDGGMTPPADLSEVIIAGVEPEWRRAANARTVGLAIARVLLVVAGVLWVVWGVQLLGTAGGLTPVAVDGVVSPDADPETASLLIDAAAVRFSFALGLLTVAWKPRLVSPLLVVFGALWTFLFGFLMRDFVLDTVGAGQVMGLALLLFTLVSLAWAWLSHHGYVSVRALLRELGSGPV
ncbi:MAG: zf-HC2 domain-containing protein [Corynebacterium sp.]|uniref:zf-HC2 domain-containing protein n=1 Tax=Corynebacterium sp. TaxID=1720 RepID=UPI0026E0C4B2|nr:zf-HC2 domain-containing protein [Corynebacterium sp.]MDO5669621.1 zf-HC2 domain-containing protein [Corynebacterium sp.]